MIANSEAAAATVEDTALTAKKHLHFLETSEDLASIADLQRRQFSSLEAFLPDSEKQASFGWGPSKVK